MTRVLFTFMINLLWLQCSAQVDYNQLQDNITAVCGVQSRESVESDKAFLDSLSTYEIKVGLEDFLLDKAWVYYLHYLYQKDNSDLKTSRQLFEKCWLEFQNRRALYNLIVIAAIQKECEKMSRLSTIYSEKFSDVEYKSSLMEIERMGKQCQ